MDDVVEKVEDLKIARSAEINWDLQFLGGQESCTGFLWLVVHHV